MSDIGSRHLAEYLTDPNYCPENQSTGCKGCTGEVDCWKELHNTDKCWEVLNETCPICWKEAREAGILTEQEGEDERSNESL